MPKAPDCHSSGGLRSESSAGLAVDLMRLAARAELLQVKTIGIVAAVLLRDVVAFLALRARQSDLGTNVGALAGHGVPLLDRMCRWMQFV